MINYQEKMKNRLSSILECNSTTIKMSRIGTDIFTSKTGLLGTIQYSKDINADIFQIFLRNPRSVKKCTKKDPDQLIKLGQLLEENDLKMVIHSPYVLNFCKDDCQNLIDFMVTELADSAKIGDRCLGCILHLGKSVKLDYDDAIDNFCDNIRNILGQSDDRSTLILETSSGQGTEICYNLDKFCSEIYDKFTDEEKERLKICVDTAHIWAANYELNDNNLVNILEEKIGWDNIVCIHFQSSKVELGKRVDRHEDIGYGKIPEEQLKFFAKLAKENNTPLILEVKGKNISKADQIKKIKDWFDE